MTDVNLEVYLDDKIYKAYEVSCSELPQFVSVPVNGVSHLKVNAFYDKYEGGYPAVGLANLRIK